VTDYAHRVCCAAAQVLDGVINQEIPSIEIAELINQRSAALVVTPVVCTRTSIDSSMKNPCLPPLHSGGLRLGEERACHRCCATARKWVLVGRFQFVLGGRGSRRRFLLRPLRIRSPQCIRTRWHQVRARQSHRLAHARHASQQATCTEIAGQLKWTRQLACVDGLSI
jgi:hypothetical protein